MPLSHNMTRNLYQESKQGLTSSIKFPKCIVFFLFLTFLKWFFSSYIGELDTLPRHTFPPDYSLCLIVLKMTQDSSVNFSSVRVIFHATGVVPLWCPRAPLPLSSRRDLCAAGLRWTLWGDWITSLSQLSVMTWAPCAMLTSAAIATTAWRRSILTFFLLVPCFCFLWVCFHSVSWHQLLLNWA